MSFEGREEYLCEKGHHIDRDFTFGEPPPKCECGSRMAYAHLIDETNGYDPNYSATFEAPKEEIGLDEEGRRIYKPLLHWTKLSDPVCLDCWDGGFTEHGKLCGCDAGKLMKQVMEDNPAPDSQEEYWEQGYIFDHLTRE